MMPSLTPGDSFSARELHDALDELTEDDLDLFEDATEHPGAAACRPGARVITAQAEGNQNCVN